MKIRTKICLLLSSFLLFGFAIAPFAQAQQLKVNVKAFLQGSYAAKGKMTQNANYRSVLESQFVKGQTETEKALQTPANALDKITIELRSASNLAQVVGSASAWLLADGSILDFKTGAQNFVSFENVAAGSYYIWVQHRNHLPLVSAKTVNLAAEGVGFWDFTVKENLSANGAYVLSSNGECLMAAGNIFSNAKDMWEINALDLQTALEQKHKKSTGYLSADINLDGKVDDADLRMVQTNAAELYSFTLTPTR